MIEVEVLGGALAPGAPSQAEIELLCAAAAASTGIEDGHVAIEFVAEQRIAALNGEHRERPRPTDVLSFPIDGVGPLAHGAGDADRTQAGGERVPRELGDIIICPAHTVDLREAIVHGMLHLLGMDHETDGGEMLALQDRLLAAPRR